jgi:hypothetical protein
MTEVEVDVDGTRVAGDGNDVSLATAPTVGDWVAPQALTNIKSVTIKAMALDRAKMMIPLFGADVIAVSGGRLAWQLRLGMLVAKRDIGATLPLIVIGRCAPGHGPA